MDRLDLLKLSPYLEDQFTVAIATATHNSVYDLCLKESMDCCEWLTDDMEMALIRSAAQECVKFAEAETAKLRADLSTALEALSKLTNEVQALNAFNLEICSIIGNTNWNVLALRVREAIEILASHKENTDG